MSAAARRALLVLALLHAAPAHGGDPSLCWRTVETPHFAIHYYTGLGRLARRLAVVAEDAHRRLQPYMGNMARGRTQVVLTDDTDDANGSATVVPSPIIRLYATAPEDRSELGDHDDWLSALFLHEYAHILHLDNINGISRVFNAVLGFGGAGRLLSPNLHQPRFVTEGVAVLAESRLSSGGRLRSTIVDMWLRMATLEDKLLRIDQYSAVPRQFPQGGAPYLYGGALIDFIARRYGETVMARVAGEQGKRLPWGLNRALRRTIGRSYAEVDGEMREDLRRRYAAQKARIERLGITATRVLTGPRPYAVRPTFAPDGGSVVWADSDGGSRAQLRRIDVGVDGARPRTLLAVDGIGGSVLSPDGGTVYYSAVNYHRTFYAWADLYRVDLATGDERRLTRGLRAAEPALSPDGRTLAFVVNDAGSRSLASMSVDGGPVTRLLGNLDDLSQVYTPAFSPDGKRLAFSWWRDGGWRDIWILELGPGTLMRVTADRAMDLGPAWSPDGKRLYFSSDRSGVANLYAWDAATGEVRQVTNVLGGAFDVAVSPDGRRAVFVGFEAEGWRLEEIALDPARWRVAPEALRDRPDSVVPRGEAPLASRAYQPWRTLWPRTILPGTFADPWGQVITLSLGGSDAVGHHRWSVSAGLNLGRLDAVPVDASYTYSRLFPELSIVASRRLLPRRLVSDEGERRYVEDDYALSLAVDLPLLRRYGQVSDLTLAHTVTFLRDAGEARPAVVAGDPPSLAPESGMLSTAGAVWSYSSARRFLYSISPEQGRSLALRAGVALRALGSSYDVYAASWRWSEYLPLGGRHVLYLSYSGGVAGGDARRRGVFALGGYPSIADLASTIFDLARAATAVLRGYGYNAQVGDQFHSLTAEYRFPVWNIERGYHTLPVYVRRLHGAVFVDAGNAFSGPFDLSAVKLGAGAEARIDLHLGYFVPVTLQLGYAYGFMAEGGHQGYLRVSQGF